MKLGDAGMWRCRMSSLFSGIGGNPFWEEFSDSGGKMSNDFKEQMKKKIMASNAPKPSHCVELSSQELLTDEFGKDLARIKGRFQQYQEAIDNFRKTHK